MMSNKISCGNGWEVRVSMIDGNPFITAEHTEGGMVKAESTSVEDTETGVKFSNWHPVDHNAEASQARLLGALKKIRESGWNEHPTAIWMQKVAAHAMEPQKWPEQPDQPPH